MEPLEGKMAGKPSPKPGSQTPGNVSTKLQRIAELARKMPEVALTTLSHHIDLDFLRKAYELIRKDAAPGVDGQTAADYAERLDENLQSLLDRFKSGNYRAPPVRRVYIPKGDGTKLRPIGIPTFEDKVLQRAVAMVLTAVYEQDFLDCSYGFRPGRSQHQALDAVWQATKSMGGGWLVELDIQSFYDTLVRKHLRSFLDQRVQDGVLRRMIDKWLKAGVLEKGELMFPSSGTPQGGVVSPILANLYLHEVLDKWFEHMVRPVLEGRAELIRFADDAVLVFSSERDARRVLNTLPKRFAKFGLTLHPEKTRMLSFHRPRVKPGARRRTVTPGSFDFLGFTHYWGRSRRGGWVVKRKTATSRFNRALKRVAGWCRRYRHLPVKVQHKALCAKLRGHYGYYGITGNFRALSRFEQKVHRVWRYWLDRRSQKRHMPWPRFNRLLARYALSKPVVVHSVYRLAAKP